MCLALRMTRFKQTYKIGDDSFFRELKYIKNVIPSIKEVQMQMRVWLDPILKKHCVLKPGEEDVEAESELGSDVDEETQMPEADRQSEADSSGGEELPSREEEQLKLQLEQVRARNASKKKPVAKKPAATLKRKAAPKAPKKAKKARGGDGPSQVIPVVHTLSAEELERKDIAIQQLDAHQDLFFERGQRVMMDPTMISPPLPGMSQRDFDLEWAEELAVRLNQSYDVNMFQCVVAVNIPEKKAHEVTIEDIMNAEGRYAIAGQHSAAAIAIIKRNQGSSCPDRFLEVPVTVVINGQNLELTDIGINHNIKTATRKPVTRIDMIKFYRKVLENKEIYGCTTKNWKQRAVKLWFPRCSHPKKV
jgi:hypothetical protein